MTPQDRDPDRFKVRLLFGLFEADASGAVAIRAVVLIFVLMGIGRLVGAW